MYIVFYSTSNVFKAEELLINGGISCEVVPTCSGQGLLRSLHQDR